MPPCHGGGRGFESRPDRSSEKLPIWRLFLFVTVCKQIHHHKTFRGIAMRGQCSLGWFYGFKLHVFIDDKGGIIDFLITAENVDDRNPLQLKKCQIEHLRHRNGTNYFKAIFLHS